MAIILLCYVYLPESSKISNGLEFEPQKTHPKQT